MATPVGKGIRHKKKSRMSACPSGFAWGAADYLAATAALFSAGFLKVEITLLLTREPGVTF